MGVPGTGLSESQGDGKGESACNANKVGRPDADQRKSSFEKVAGLLERGEDLRYG